MEHRFNKIDAKLDKILDKVGDHRERLAALETKQKGHTTIFTMLWSVVLSGIAILYKKLGG